MFSINLKRLYTACDGMIVRTMRKRLGPNPGLDSRARLFKKESLQLEDIEDCVEESEANFFKAGQMLTEHNKQTEVLRDKLRKHIVEQKYFKTEMPNLLTWSEKEQIRLLNSEDPDEWTPERIAESFPVTALIAKKLLKYPWKPSTMERIARHDASAMRNWRELKEGTLDIPPELREHFLKFSNRSIPPLSKKSIKIDVTRVNMGEFQAIVDRCAKNSEPSQTNKENGHSQSNEEDSNNANTYKQSNWQKKQSKKVMTLDELTNKIKHRLDSGKEVDVPDQIIVQNTTTLAQEPAKYQGSNVEQTDKDLTIYVKRDSAVHITEYPERIRIPKKAYKKGATYKVDDCYYDADGRFLYRVIGITS